MDGRRGLIRIVKARINVKICVVAAIQMTTAL